MHRLPAGIKVAGAVATVVATALLPREHWPWLFALAGLLVLVALASRIPLWVLVKRVLVLEPLVIGVAVMALFQQGGAALFGFLLARCTLSLVALVIMGWTTTFSELLAVFRFLRMPLLLVTTIALMHRYTSVLREEALRMRRARASRRFTRGRRREWGGLATVIGRLFVRSSGRAERIYAAMRARGWEEA